MSTTAYRKEYKMRLVGRQGVETTIPKLVIEKAAREHKLSIEEFVKNFKVVHLFNHFSSFDGAYRFEPIKEPEEELEVIEII